MSVTLLPVSTLVLLVVSWSVAAIERPCKIGTVDGCSVPFNLDVPYKNTFTVACDRHDVCYGCGKDARYAINRTKCDDMFLDHMLEICKGKNVGKDCKDFATVYYKLVSEFAKVFYKLNPRSWCGHKRVPECIKP